MYYRWLFLICTEILESEIMIEAVVESLRLLFV